MHVHIDPETLKRYPWIGVLIGLAGSLLMVFLTVDFYHEFMALRTIPAPTSMTAATAALLPGERSTWVTLSDGVCHHDLVVREERSIPERWIFGKVDNTQVPVTDGKGRTLIIIKHDGNAESRSLEGHPVTGMLVREHDHLWGGGVSPHIRLTHTEPLLVLVPGAGPWAAFLYTLGGLGFLLVFTMFAFYYLVVWFRKGRAS
jgi:hypothetical protein